MTSWVKFDDYATPATAQQIALMRAAGVRVVGRYAGLGGAWKHLTPTERDLLFAAGIGIFPLAEAVDNRALAGHAAGAADARAARAAWSALGLPARFPICFAVDFNATADELAGPVAAYFQGIASVEQGDYDYGGATTVDFLSSHRLVGGGFQTYAWSAGRWSKFAVIKQERNDVPTLNGSDLGEIESTVPFWYVQPAVPPRYAPPLAGDWSAVLRDGHSAAEDQVLTVERAGWLANVWAPTVSTALAKLQSDVTAILAAVSSHGAPAAGPSPAAAEAAPIQKPAT